MKKEKPKGKDKIFKLDDLSQETMLKDVVFVNGCFDMLHSGHVSLLNWARKEMDGVIVVGINGDESVSRLKGKSRPIIPAAQRAYLLSNLECVDYVFIFSDDNVIKPIEQLQPVIWVKGPDYNMSKIDNKEFEALKSVGGKLKYMNEVPDELFNSTTLTIKKIEKNNS